MASRTPPHDLEAEANVLASMLMEREAIERVADFLRPEHFYRISNGTLYAAMLDLYERGDPVDTTTVRHELGDGKIEEVGGYGYLLDLSTSLATTAHAAFYGNIVVEKATIRAVIKAGTEIVAKSYKGDVDADTLVDDAERLILAVAQKRGSSEIVHIADGVSEAMEDIRNRVAEQKPVSGISTGFYDLDSITCGFQKSDLLILAARPSMGKSALALNFASEVARKGKPVLVYSLEMGYKQLITRMLCSESEVDSGGIRKGFVSPEAMGKLESVAGQISKMPIYIEDSSIVSVSDIRQKARRIKMEHGEIGLVLIDYLQLMSGPPDRNNNRTAEMGAISRGLKQLAREIDAPVMALSQLSRAVESRTDKRPMLSDLRESGAIEQDADIVMFIYRDEYYNPDTSDKSIAELIIAKHRNGPVGRIKLYFNSSKSKFQDLVGSFE